MCPLESTSLTWSCSVAAVAAVRTCHDSDPMMASTRHCVCVSSAACCSRGGELPGLPWWRGSGLRALGSLEGLLGLACEWEALRRRSFSALAASSFCRSWYTSTCASDKACERSGGHAPGPILSLRWGDGANVEVQKYMHDCKHCAAAVTSVSWPLLLALLEMRGLASVLAWL